MSLIIGLIGESGGGKDSFVSALRACRSDLSIESFKSSDILFETLKIWNIETTRQHLQALPVAMESTYGKGVLTRATGIRLEGSAAAVALFNGIRWQSDVDLVRTFPRHVLVYVTADPELRFQRLHGRGEKVGETDMTYEQFLMEEQAATERDIARIGAAADLIIHNNGTKEALAGEVRAFAEEYLKGVSA
ncbi:hypothetical protein FJY93_05370 [Candidatus Kaiserbacteria bacterium]|nr:hypothetical protein [Candidatus Kaiserbacteria bacterium]